LKLYGISYITKEESYCFNNYCCDECNNDENALENGVLHCDKCLFDICGKCEKDLMAKNHWDNNDNPIQTVKFCDGGHPLLKAKNLKDIAMNKTPDYTANVFYCHECKTKNQVSGQNEAYHCDYCEFDLCLKCFENYPGKETNEVTCENGHHLIKTHDLKSVVLDEDESYQANLYNCDLCQTTEIFAGEVGAYHCDICKFDLCPKCVDDIRQKPLDPTIDKYLKIRRHCPKGHLMGMTNTLNLFALKDEGYSDNTYICDICETAKEADKETVFHCDLCMYDLCLTCSRK